MEAPTVKIRLSMADDEFAHVTLYDEKGEQQFGSLILSTDLWQRIEEQGSDVLGPGDVATVKLVLENVEFRGAEEAAPRRSMTSAPEDPDE